MRSTRDFLTGLLTGVAIGILTAPRSGKETREKIVDEANKRGEDLKGQWEKGVSQAKDQFEKVKDQASQYAGQVKDQASQYVGQAKEKLNDVKDQAENEYYANKGEVKSEYNNAVDTAAEKAKDGINSVQHSAKF